MTKTQRTRTWQSRRWPGRLPSSPLDCQRRRLVAGGNRSSVPALFLRLKFTLPKMPIPAPMVRSCVTCSPGRHLPTLLRTKVPTLTPSVLHRRRRPLWRCLAARPRCRCPHPQRFFCRRLCRSSSRASRQPLPNCCHSSALLLTAVAALAGATLDAKQQERTPSGQEQQQKSQRRK